jgi:hypothetical protein
MDYGNVSAVEYMAKDYNGNVIIFDEWWDYKSVRTEKVKNLKKFAVERGLQGVRIEADTNMWVPDQFDAVYTSDPAQDFISAGLYLSKVSKTVTRATGNRGYRIACNDAVRDYLHWEGDGVGNLSIRPKLLIYDRCKRLIETLPTLRVDDKDVEDIADDDNDHFYDAAKMGFMTLYAPSRPKEIKPYATEAEYMQATVFDKIKKRAMGYGRRAEAI